MTRKVEVNVTVVIRGDREHPVVVGLDHDTVEFLRDALGIDEAVAEIERERTLIKNLDREPKHGTAEGRD